MANILEEIHEEITKVAIENTKPLVDALYDYEHTQATTLYSIKLLIKTLESLDPDFYRDFLIPELAQEVNYAIQKERQEVG